MKDGREIFETGSFSGPGGLAQRQYYTTIRPSMSFLDGGILHEMVIQNY